MGQRRIYLRVDQLNGNIQIAFWLVVATNPAAEEVDPLDKSLLARPRRNNGRYIC